MSLMRRWLYFRNRSEPLRQATLLLMLAGAAGRGESLLQVLRSYHSTASGDWASQILQLSTLLESGHSLTTALTLVDDLLPPQVMAAITAAEASGCLSAVMRDEADRMIRRMTESRGKADGILFVAASTGTVLFSLAAFIAVFIVPKMLNVYAGFGLELPALTLFLFGLLDVFNETWYFLVLPAFCLTCWGVWYSWQDARHRLIRGSPLGAGMRPRYWTPGVLRMFSVATVAGEPLTAAMKAAVQQLPAGRAADRMFRLRELLERGESIPGALEQSRMLSRRDAAFLRSATVAGHPEWALRQLADRLEDRRQRSQRRRRQLLAAVFQTALGLLVLWFALALFMPLIKLMNHLS